MFGLSWSEILIIGVVALVLIGPNDLPRAMKTAARWMSAGRKLAREFQSHVDDLVREAELDELREKARKLATQPLSSHLETMVDPDREIAQSLTQSEVYQAMMTGQVSPPAAEPAAETVIPPPSEPPAAPPPEPAAQPQTTP
jgi:sec-independent protein translocase protein TatB